MERESVCRRKQESLTNDVAAYDAATTHDGSTNAITNDVVTTHDAATFVDAVVWSIKEAVITKSGHE